MAAAVAWPPPRAQAWSPPQGRGPQCRDWLSPCRLGPQLLPTESEVPRNSHGVYCPRGRPRGDVSFRFTGGHGDVLPWLGPDSSVTRPRPDSGPHALTHVSRNLSRLTGRRPLWPCVVQNPRRPVARTHLALISAALTPRPLSPVRTCFFRGTFSKILLLPKSRAQQQEEGRQRGRRGNSRFPWERPSEAGEVLTALSQQEDAK